MAFGLVGLAFFHSVCGRVVCLFFLYGSSQSVCVSVFERPVAFGCLDVSVKIVKTN